MRVLVPRGGDWGADVARRLRERGHEPVIVPLIDVQPVPFDVPAGYDWLVVTSATTARLLPEVPAATRIAAIGAATAEALTRVDFVPSDSSSRGLVAEWPGGGTRILLPQSDLADPWLGEQLGADTVVAYRTVGLTAQPVTVDASLVTSGSVARSLGQIPEHGLVIAIGPRTADEARAAGLAVHRVAAERSVSSLLDALE